ncbi:unnamed protein product, partial [Coccothraustes coccothraustes]
YRVKPDVWGVPILCRRDLGTGPGLQPVQHLLFCCREAASLLKQAGDSVLFDESRAQVLQGAVPSCPAGT